MDFLELDKQSSQESYNEELGGYTFGKTLGQGEYGLVKEALHELTGEKVAVKILDKHLIKDRRKTYKIKKEFKIL